MNVHTGTVVTNDWFWHEGYGFAVLVSNVLDNVFLTLSPVSTSGQGSKTSTDFVLTSGSYFVVMYFNRNANFFQNVTHSGTDVLERVDWWYREVTAFSAWTVTHVAIRVNFLRVPACLRRVDFDEAAAHVCTPADIVKNEEFRFWTKECSVCKTSGFQVGFSAHSDGTWVTLITFHGGRVNDTAGNVDSDVLEERINESSVRIWHEDHVGFINAFPASNGGTIKHLAFSEGVFFHGVCRNSNVLLFAAGIRETEIYVFGFTFFDQIQNVLCRLRHYCLLMKLRVYENKLKIYHLAYANVMPVQNVDLRALSSKQSVQSALNKCSSINLCIFKVLSRAEIVPAQYSAKCYKRLQNLQAFLAWLNLLQLIPG